MAAKWKPKFEVGQEVWRFDIDRRRYPTDDQGRVIGRAIYHEHFTDRKKVAEVTATGYRFEGDSHLWAGKVIDAFHYTSADREVMIWNEAAYRISEAVRSSGIDTLRKVAELVNFVPDGLIPPTTPES